jgi:hypothetical protein
MHKPKFLDPETLDATLTYDPSNGQFSRKSDGRLFTSRYINEYRQVSYKGGSARAGRAAWVMMTGQQPDIIDHINGMKHDDRWCNLRSVSIAENNRNRVSHRIKNGTYVSLEDCS